MILTAAVGTIVSRENGKAVAYALWNLEERGPCSSAPAKRSIAEW